MEKLVELFQQYPHLAIGISLLASAIIAILGLIPSVFITAANILFFGLVYGTIISFAGEAIGAAIAFLLYRYGLRKKLTTATRKYKKMEKLVTSEGMKAFQLIFLFRLLPFIPSGIITFTAAIGKVSFTTFILASSSGKIPALLIEAWSVYHVTEFGVMGKIILSLAAIILIFIVLKKRW